MTKFKCGVLPIMIETGRYKDVPLEDRLCQICTDKCVKDEQHFSGTCKALSHIRGKFKEKFCEEGIDIGNISVQTVKSMLHPDHIKLSCDLLQELFEERKVLMYDIVDIDAEVDTNEMHVGEARVT